MANEDPWDAPDPTKLRISAVQNTRPLPRPPVRSTPAPASPPPHHASPAAGQGALDEAAVEAPPIPRPEKPQAPKPAVIDTRVSRGERPVAMVDGLHGASWRDHDTGTLPKTPPVRPWARNAGITIGVFATLTILVVVGSVLFGGLLDYVDSLRKAEELGQELPTPSEPTPGEPPAFPEPLETSILDEGDVPARPLDPEDLFPPQVDPYAPEAPDAEP